MKRTEAVAALAAAFALASAGAVWQFGVYGLYGAAVVLVAAVSFAHVK